VGNVSLFRQNATAIYSSYVSQSFRLPSRSCSNVLRRSR
jgi:hypothetical protein